MNREESGYIGVEALIMCITNTLWFWLFFFYFFEEVNDGLKQRQPEESE